MSATAFDPLKAVAKHANVSIDDTSGLRYGMESAGLLLTEANYNPERDVKTYMDHNMEDCVHVFRNPRLTISFSGQVLAASGSAAMKQPGRPLTKSVVAEFYGDVDHEFNSAATGYFLNMNPKTKAGQGGDLYEYTWDARWFQASRNGTSQLVAAP